MTKHILLRDTRGNYSLGIRLPTKDYNPRNSLGKKKPPNRKQYMKWYKKNRNGSDYQETNYLAKN